MAEVVKNLLGGSRNVFRICFQRCAIGSEIGESFFLGDDQHLGFDAIYFAQAELVNFVGLQVGGSAAVDIVLVALLAVGQEVDGERGAAIRRVVVGDESAESFVCGDYIGVDCIGNLLGEAFLIVGGNLRGIFLGRQQERIGVNDALALHRNFLQQKFHGHQFVVHSGAQNFGGLGQHARNLMQARDVVLVVLHRIERNGKR